MGLSMLARGRALGSWRAPAVARAAAGGCGGRGGDADADRAREPTCWRSLPDPVEWYLRPVAGRHDVHAVSVGGFLLAGGAVGLWLDAARTARQERLANGALAAMGAAIALGGYAASFLPPIYEETNFWTSSPTFFFVRLGILILPCCCRRGPYGPRRS